MLTRRICCIVVTLLLVGIIPSLAQDTPTLFEATFEDGTMPDALHIQYGTHTISDGILAYTVDNGGFLLIPDGITWTDYAIEARLRLISGSVWLQARTGSDLCSGYYLTINQNKDLYDLSMANPDCDFTIFDSREPADVSSDWMTVRIEVVGNQIMTYIDETALFNATDDHYTVGYPTINIFSANDDPAKVEFDTIRVIDLSAPVADRDVTPTGDMSPTEEAIVIATSVADVTPTDLESVELPNVTEVMLSDDPAHTIENLQELGLIPTGIGELYQGEGVVISRVGAWFDPVFEDVNANHVVMSGDIRFLPYHNTESCLLSVRILRDEVGVAQRYLDVGINSRLEVFIGETDETGAYSQASQEGVLTLPDGNILLVADGNRLSVFINGHAVFQNVDVTEREGGMGVSAIASTSYTVCHVTNIWVYTFDN